MLATGPGGRLDQVVPALTGLSRRAVRALLQDGAVWLNGRPCRVASRRIALGDVIDLLLPAAKVRLSETPLPVLDVLLDDGWLVAVNKPRGMHTQPPRDPQPGQLSAIDATILQLSHREGHRVDLKLFHRLDRITSGVLVFARNHEAARGLARAWAGGAAVKRYLAVVRGTPPESLEIAEPILADAGSPGRFRTGRGGRPARTLARCLASGDGVALVEVRPFTGRTHQVRVHLASRGFPVVGDALYGGGTAPPGPFLHAWRLDLPHPRDRRNLRLEAPVPGDLRDFLEGRAVNLGAVLP